MKHRRIIVLAVVCLVFLSLALTLRTINHSSAKDHPPVHRQVIVPGEDRFTPFAITIHSGETVEWVNKDTDDHTVVSDDFFTTAGHKHTDLPLPGTDSNGGKPGTLTLRFSRPGMFVYYCKFHAHLDIDHQPAAIGLRGGIPDTPMMGVVTVLPNDEE